MLRLYRYTYLKVLKLGHAKYNYTYKANSTHEGDKRMFHNKTHEEVIRTLNSNAKYGLKDEKVKEMWEQYGKNELEEKPKKNIIIRFLAQFNDFMIFILLLAALISFILGMEERDFLDPIIILLIIVLNAILSMAQEGKAERALKALKTISAPRAKVIRNGKVESVETSSLVPGDIIIIQPGSFVPADARLLESNSLKIDESPLTGESYQVEKDADVIIKKEATIGDRINMIYSGTSVVLGKGRAIITATGMDTELGKIAGLVLQAAPHTPLQIRLEKTGKLLGIVAIAICAVIFTMGVMQGVPMLTMFMTSVSLAVAAIPEGLPAIVTITLALGVLRMAKRKSIIRKLPAVETLGSANVICSDKTGTLTQNKMKVVDIRGIFPLKSSSNHRKTILNYAALCNDAILQEDNEVSVVGEPTETALINMAIRNNINKNELENENPRVGTLPFDSKRKLMTTVHKTPQGYLSITKGAPDYLIKICDNIYDRGEQPMTGQAFAQVQDQNNVMAANALRVIAIAYKRHKTMPLINATLEKELTFLGLIGIIDPPRKEAYIAVNLCRKAGIKPVMITGDHVVTAIAISKELGIMQSGDKAITGEEIDNISEEDLAKNINNYSVFARVSPMHKMTIVRAYQTHGNVVAMTGDGVNDAPALKAANIGCAMGSGTDVAKDAADMVLIDDNFATIVDAVREGRGIYNNIKKAIHFLLSSNVGEIVAILAALILGWQTPLLAIHLLWINLVTDSLPAIALGLEKPEEDIMEQKPQNVNSFFAGGLWQKIATEGLMIGLLATISFGIGKVYFDTGASFVVATTMAFATLSISQLFHAFNVRTSKSILGPAIKENLYLVLAFFTGVVLQIGVIQSPLHQIFRVVPLSSMQWLIVFALSIVPIIVVEIQKKVR